MLRKQNILILPKYALKYLGVKRHMSPNYSQMVQEIIIGMYTNMCMCIHVVYGEKEGVGKGRKGRW